MPKIQLHVPREAWANALVLLPWVLMWVRGHQFPLLSLLCLEGELCQKGLES